MIVMKGSDKPLRAFTVQVKEIVKVIQTPTATGRRPQGSSAPPKKVDY